jgi:LYR motif-containing protein 4
MVDNTPARNRAGQIDHDVFEGLPVRRWSRQAYTVSQDAKIDEPSNSHATSNANATVNANSGSGGHTSLNAGSQTGGSGSSHFRELPMPKDSNLLAPSSRALLRAARAGCKYIKIVNNNTSIQKDKPLADRDHLDEARIATDGGGSNSTTYHQRSFTARKWGQVPRHLEPPEPEYLAKRRPGLPSLYGASGVSNLGTPSVSYMSGGKYPFRPTDQHMRKTRFKRNDPETGKVVLYEVWLPDGHRVEGEIQESAPEPKLRPEPAGPTSLEAPAPLQSTTPQNKDDTSVTSIAMDITATMEPQIMDIPPPSVDIRLPPAQSDMLVDEQVNIEISASPSIIRDQIIPSKRRSEDPDENVRKKVMFAPEQYDGPAGEIENQVTEEEQTVQPEDIGTGGLDLGQMEVDSPMELEHTLTTVREASIPIEDLNPTAVTAEPIPTTSTEIIDESWKEKIEESPADEPPGMAVLDPFGVENIQGETTTPIPPPDALTPDAVTTDAPQSAAHEDDTVSASTEPPVKSQPAAVISPPAVPTAIEIEQLYDTAITSPAPPETKGDNEEVVQESELAKDPVSPLAASTDYAIPKAETGALDQALEPKLSEQPVYVGSEHPTAPAESEEVSEAAAPGSGDDGQPAEALDENIPVESFVPGATSGENGYLSPPLPPLKEPIPEMEGSNLPDGHEVNPTMATSPEPQTSENITSVSVPEAEHPALPAVEEDPITETEIPGVNKAESEEEEKVANDPA